MTERLNRKELYDLVWSEPMKTLSARFGISDVALKKACVRVGIPTPERGYWARKDAVFSARHSIQNADSAPVTSQKPVSGASRLWQRR